MTDDESHLALLTLLGAGAYAVTYLHTKALSSAAEVPFEEEARRTERLVRIRDQAATLKNAYDAAVAQHSRLDKLMADYEAARLASMQGLRLAAKSAIDEVAMLVNSSCTDYLDQQRAIARRLPPLDEPAPETLVLQALPSSRARPPVRQGEHGGVVLLIMMVCCGIALYASKRRQTHRTTTQTASMAHATYRQHVRLVATRNDEEDDGHASTRRVP
ncbi:hypothetical protein, variant 1 [Saprolegnia diclina VS20]|uniref:Uncharacterized protein n=1 Tax=Saprolegnia diclina (strain VS20) TaxID=1156394 RepID=T0Q9V3_SAPDV|nr:hypothetical protein, variant 1 [Saprolegnia diclina VS20]EQC31411.1 hypothetical protein, variant 1 [Saprolegnia diclina VS20]|eukprot:XP_008615252.1 hypothetical protein, variant 1 [Saprolegnia diclina VS20]